MYHLSPYMSESGARKHIAPASSRRQSLQRRRPRYIRSSEYKNLKKVVPSLRRQRDVEKVEVVTEAARYIDHLHNTLIERFVLFGIPDSLKGILGTDDSSELSSKHIMNLVSQMAAGQQSQQSTVGSASNRLSPGRTMAQPINQPTNPSESTRQSSIANQTGVVVGHSSSASCRATGDIANNQPPPLNGARGARSTRKQLPVVVVNERK